MSIIGSNLIAGASGQADGAYEIERSLRFNRSDTAYLGFTPSSAGNQKTWTWSAWLKRSRVSASGDYYYLFTPNGDSVIRFNDNDTLEFYDTGGSKGYLITNQVFRDVSAWYHIVYVLDTTVSSPSSDRLKLYVNGERVTSFSTESYPSQNVTLGWNAAVAHSLGRWELYAAQYFDGYMTEVNFVDGTALTASDFGETDTATGAWIPKKYGGSYGTNGFYLNFSDNSSVSALGTDSSGNGNNWTPNNFSVTAGAGNDSLEDTPTNNFCTANSVYAPSSQSLMDLANGNLDVGQAATNKNCSVAATFGMSTGKWYWEVTNKGSQNYRSIGMQTVEATAWRGTGTVLYRSDGQKLIDGTNSSYGASYTTNDVLGFAYDADTGSLTVYKNNASQGVIFSAGSGKTYVPCVHDDNAGSGVTYFHNLNFGQRAFEYTPPAGYKALNTANLPEPTIKDGTEYFTPVLYTGNGTSQSITVADSQGNSWAPDLVWLKMRSSTGAHFIYDTVRGATNGIHSNLTDAENSYSDGLTSFNNDGFSLGSRSNNNGSSSTYVAWNWKAGGSSSSNTDGTITSTVSANVDAGFSIVSYTGNGTAGATIGHGLSATPAMMIVKNRDATDEGMVYHKDLDASNPSNYYLKLFPASQASGAKARSSIGSPWNDTEPTSSVFSVSSEHVVNASGEDYIAYVFAEVEGFSKLGTYTGNGSSTDGPFVACGFRPAFVLTKRTDTDGFWWEMVDSSRETFNPSSETLYANVSDSEYSGSQYNKDFLSNGFKPRGNNGGHNASGGTYIFMAFAETPFKYSTAR